MDLAIIGSSGSTGLYTGVLCGLAVEYYGPRLTLRLGAILVFCGNLYIWLSVQRLLWHSVIAISVAYAIAQVFVHEIVFFVLYLLQVGIACVTATAMVVAIRCFPCQVTGKTAGLAKGYFGVSSAVLSTCSAIFFHAKSIHFIIFVAISLPAVQLYASFNVRKCYVMI